jgi:hypothetical protein
VVGFFEYGNESAGSIKMLRIYRLEEILGSQKDFTPRN